MRTSAIMALNMFLLAFIIWSHFEIQTFQATGFLVSELKVGTSVGDLAPSFTVKTLDGVVITSEDLEGKPYVLYFFTTWCPSCHEELGILREVYPKYKDKVALISIDMDSSSKGEIERFIKSNDYPGIFGSAEPSVITSFEAIRASTTYVITKEGQIAYKKSGVLDKDNWEKAFSRLAA